MLAVQQQRPALPACAACLHLCRQVEDDLGVLVLGHMLGRGGNGVVFAAKLYGMDVAVKVGSVWGA